MTAFAPRCHAVLLLGVALLLIGACMPASAVTPSDPAGQRPPVIESDAPAHDLECVQDRIPCDDSGVPAPVRERTSELADAAAARLVNDSPADVGAWLDGQDGVARVWTGAQAVRFRLEGGRPAWAAGCPVPPGNAASPAILAVMPDPTSLYDRAGGSAFFEALVARFYAGVETDPLLRAVYPEPDLAPARRRLTLFLVQYWGGPTTYGQERGHPRLRMRHAPFAIGSAERDRWLHHMRAAIAETAVTPDVADELERYIEMAAEAMRNRD